MSPHDMAALEPEALLHDFADLADVVGNLIGRNGNADQATA